MTRPLADLKGLCPFFSFRAVSVASWGYWVRREVRWSGDQSDLVVVGSG